MATATATASTRRSWWVDGLEAAVWLVCAAGIAFMFASGGLIASSATDWLYTLGRGFGIVAAVLMMTQVLLASRAPWVERAIGHDRAIAIHTKVGIGAIVLMAIHLTLMTTMTASYDGRSALEQVTHWPEYGWYMTAALIAALAFAIVFFTSIAAVRLRWRYERWHAVHLLVYVGVALAVPHQFLEGTTFRTQAVAWWFWALLWTVSIGSFVTYRLIRPAVRAWKYRLVVESVDQVRGGATSIVVSGRNLDQLGARSGQFFLWRFLAPGLRGQSHPYSLSAAPGGKLRLTVRPSGDGSAALASVPVGTHVMAEGPLGIFTHDSRTADQALFVVAGIGVTPVRSMLEDVAPGDNVQVVVRARTLEEAPLLDEVEQLCAERNVPLTVVLGPRGTTWGSQGDERSLADMVDDPSRVDVFVCGPRPWALQVEADARAAGISAASIHREEFGW